MVAPNLFTYILEIKNERDENLLDPIRLSSVSVQPYRSMHDLIYYREDIYNHVLDNRGYITTTFICSPNHMDALLYPPGNRFNLCIKPHPTSESYVSYKNSIPIRYNYFVQYENALVQYDITWYYTRNEHMLTPPRELQGGFVDLNAIPMHNRNSRYRNYLRPQVPNEISQVNWKESGF